MGPAGPEGTPQAGAGPQDMGYRLADLLFEAASLKRTPRTGYQFLGRGRESVAEHSFGAAMVAFALGSACPGANLAKLLSMTLFHDLSEARVGDQNYVNKRYVVADEDAAFRDAIKDLPFEGDLAGLWTEWRAGETLEAKLAKDADQLDMILELKRLADHGWRQASDWLFYAAKRLQTEPGRLLAERILSRGADDWWFERRDELWINPKPPEAGELDSGAPDSGAPETGTLDSGAPETGERDSGWPNSKGPAAAKAAAPGADAPAGAPPKPPGAPGASGEGRP